MCARMAYCSVPKDGGTYTFYVELRKELEKRGYEVICLSTGRTENGLWDQSYAVPGCVALEPGEDDLKKLSRAFCDFLEQEEIDLFMPMNSKPALSAIPHTPARIRLVSRIADISPVGFKIVSSCAWAAHRVVANSLFQRDRIVGKYGVDRDKTVLIPHGIDTDAFAPSPDRDFQATLKIAFAGRMDDSSKGVLYIPAVLDELDRRGVSYHMEFIGEGEKKQELSRILAERVRRGSVAFCGRISRKELAERLAQSHLLLFPSRWEGFGFSLIESMACGCVPVATLLPGVTDFILGYGKAGVLCRMGDTAGFAEGIEALDRDRDRLKVMSQAARDEAVGRFSLDRFGEEYAELFETVLGEPPLDRKPASWDEFRPCPAFDRTWRSMIPEPVKAPVRNMKWFASLRGRYKF